MPIQPCPNCSADAPRLLQEASRTAYVWYYRCESCGHVWSLDKQSNEVRHVTPLKGAETDGHASSFVVDGPSAVVSSAWALLRTGMGYATAAAKTTDVTTRDRNRALAEDIDRRVGRLINQLSLRREEVAGLTTEIHRLREAIKALGDYPKSPDP